MMINSLASNSTLYRSFGQQTDCDNNHTVQKSDSLEKTNLCLSCINGSKDMTMKMETLEKKVQHLNNRIAFLSSLDNHGRSFSDSNKFYRNSTISSSTIGNKRKLVDYGFKRVKKFISCNCNSKKDCQNRMRSQSVVSELKDDVSKNEPVTKLKLDNINLHSQSNITKEAVKEFCETTTFHGFPEWYRANTIQTKTLWIFIIVFGLVGTSYEIFTVINDYRTAPTSTSYDFESPEDGMIFPQVVLCNTNFLNASKARTINMSHPVVNAAKLLILNPIEDAIGGVFDSNLTYLKNILATSDVAVNVNFMPDILEELKYDQNEFIKACFFDQQPCDVYNISIQSVPDVEYGVCFLVSTNSLQTKSGEGLQLVLDTHSDLWWTELPTFGHGVVVRIEKTYNPGMLRSYFVLPNYITKISLSATHYNMLGTTENCRHDMERKIFNFNVTYSEDICRMECFFPVALKLCGCIRSMPPEYLYKADLPQCFNSTQQLCLKRAFMVEKQDQEAQQCKRQCLPPCDSWDYRTAISMLKFPATPIIPVMEEIINKPANESRLEDFVILDIAFDQLRVTNIKQQVSITPDGFLSQIGGHLGLFLGASLMSVVQLFLIFFQWLFRWLIQKLQ